jgi:hypothetical protein
VAKNDEPQDQQGSHLVQSVINMDGSRTHQRYDEKRMLNEFVRYTFQKEQPISMDNCLNFTPLVIRDCDQPLYKRFHHRKMVADIKRQYNERKNDLLATFGYVNYKVSITSDIGRPVNTVLVTLVLLAIILMKIRFYKKSFKFSFHEISAYCTNYLSIYY